MTPGKALLSIPWLLVAILLGVCASPPVRPDGAPDARAPDASYDATLSDATCVQSGLDGGEVTCAGEVCRHNEVCYWGHCICGDDPHCPPAQYCGLPADCSGNGGCNFKCCGPGSP